MQRGFGWECRQVVRLKEERPVTSQWWTCRRYTMRGLRGDGRVRCEGLLDLSSTSPLHDICIVCQRSPGSPHHHSSGRTGASCEILSVR